MNKILATLALILAANASALECTTDLDCFDASLQLINQATKLKACTPEVNAVAADAADPLTASNKPIQALEACVARAKYQAKLKKARERRIARLNKALGVK